MGVLVLREEDQLLYDETFAEVSHIVRGATETHIDREELVLTNTPVPKCRHYRQLSGSNLARKLGLASSVLYDRLIGRGLISCINGQEKLTERGKATGAREKLARTAPSLSGLLT